MNASFSNFYNIILVYILTDLDCYCGFKTLFIFIANTCASILLVVTALAEINLQTIKCWIQTTESQCNN